MKRAVILGGTGALGRATARRLMSAGWQLDITGRQESHLPRDLRESGARFHTLDRHNSAGLAALLGDGADLLVDALCFTEADARTLLPLLPGVTSAVMLSSKAVYVDEHGNHVNSDVAPRFTAPIREDQPTMSAGHGDQDSREGYGANKVAAETLLLDSGCPSRSSAPPRCTERARPAPVSGCSSSAPSSAVPPSFWRPAASASTTRRRPSTPPRSSSGSRPCPAAAS
ncbi:NAD-dependent epimerase/dehydratase family protein [Cryobacterium melibiosiphilum]|uniref:NAD-dependent epimerase/dehydratase family protein n=1 Tax=Cryobacterium melibiosiphilum TaxID=995039 RepID=UPI001F3AB0FB|nr:NAD-dependent epimerase/dehydratase family protein [Cryobacterium melibiosiphilum]